MSAMEKKKGTAQRDEASPFTRKNENALGIRGHLLTAPKPVAERTPGGVPFIPQELAAIFKRGDSVPSRKLRTPRANLGVDRAACPHFLAARRAA